MSIHKVYHKVYIEDFETVDYHLIAMHTSLEDYRLAYFLNKKLDIYLCKSKNDIQFQIDTILASFSRFSFEDEKKIINWDLIENKNDVAIEENKTTQDLFSNSKSNFKTSTYLVSEFKKIDFFLKIENAGNEINISEVLSKIKAIDSVTMVYNIDKEKIKSKNNLIF